MLWQKFFEKRRGGDRTVEMTEKDEFQTKLSTVIGTNADSLSSVSCPLRWRSGKASASRAAHLCSVPAFAADLFSCRVLPVI